VGSEEFSQGDQEVKEEEVNNIIFFLLAVLLDLLDLLDLLVKRFYRP
jgi:hypothetical protein